MCVRSDPEQLSRSRGRRSGRREALRVSDAEREHVVDRLRVAAGEGRLEVEELEQRIEAAYRARTAGDLAEPVRDLPGPRRRRRREGARRVVAYCSLTTFALPLLLAIALISLAPPVIAWTGWALLGWWCFACLPAAGMGFAWAGLPRRGRSRRRASLAG